ncbi:MAG: dockerin type I domain-containing protein, partial [Bacillota bacterium]
ADVNVDGTVNSTDYTILKRYLIKIINSLPYKLN